MKIKCQVCKIDGYLQHIGKTYYRVRHYRGFRNGKPVFTYHKQELKYIQVILGRSNDGRIDQFDQKRVDQNLYASGSFNQTGHWAGSLVRIGRKPPKPSDIDFEQFKQFVRSKYSKIWAEAIIRYVRKYHHLLDNPVGLDTFKKYKRNNVLKSLVAYSKFTGYYTEFKQLLKDYGIRYGRADSIESFLRMVNNNGSDVLDWLNKALKILRPNEQLFLRFVMVTGLRKNEAVQSFNLIIKLTQEGRLAEYYDEELETLEHFRFKQLFLRGTKNVFISFVSKSMIEEIGRSQPVTYESIRKRLIRRGIRIRMKESRNHYATFMVRHGLIREEVDLLQGRIPANVFVRHYWTPSFNELKDRSLEAAESLKRLFLTGISPELNESDKQLNSGERGWKKRGQSIFTNQRIV